MNCSLDNEDLCFEVNFNSFPDLTTFPTYRKLDGTVIDSFSDPVYIPGGLLFGNQIVTTLYVRHCELYNHNYFYPMCMYQPR